MRQTSLPAHFAPELTRLNTFQRGRALRLYQLQIAQCGAFTLPCPITGRTLTPSASYLKPHQAIFYRFEGVAPFIAIAGSLKDGFPLIEIVAEGDESPPGAASDSALRQIALTLLKVPDPPLPKPGAGASIPIGHPNFAHFLWNEWPALLALSNFGTNALLRPSYDALGLLSRLKLPATAHPLTEGWSRTPLTFIGSDRCAATDLNRARHLLGIERVEKQPHIWITIRDRGRTPQNQVALLTAIIAKLHGHYPHLRFLLDGFSRPVAQAGNGYAGFQNAFAARIEGGKALARELKQALPGVPMTDLTGLPIDKALQKIACCQFYVSHAGSMQHKAAWLSGLPGILHGNQASITPAALRWCAAMAEGSLAPAALTADIVQDLEVQHMPNQTARNRDYMITDINRAADQTLAHYEETVRQDARRRAG